MKLIENNLNDCVDVMYTFARIKVFCVAGIFKIGMIVMY